jgi:DUF438 domain-containing protein
MEMSELLDNARKKKDLLKHMILQLHEGTAPEEVRAQLIRLMGQVPYNDIVEVEQELIAEGLPQEEVLKLCDIHTAALEGAIDHTGAKEVPPGHPVHTFKEENKALKLEIRTLETLSEQIGEMDEQADASEHFAEMQTHLHALMDVEKHYQRKENLLFPFLEKHEITGPPTVMWGKHDEARELLKGAVEMFAAAGQIVAGEAQAAIDLVVKPASSAVDSMIYKEEEILFPMCLDKLTDKEWYEIYRQSTEIGYCLYDPAATWKPKGITVKEETTAEDGKIQLPSGSFTVAELTAVLNTIPFDMTFVDSDDTVRYFTQGKERIFARNRAILGRKVQLCHPPSSVDIVERILSDFKTGEQEKAAFWITLGERFVHIEYFALRDDDGSYLGCLEVSQDLTAKRKLKGEQRLLSYDNIKE